MTLFVATNSHNIALHLLLFTSTSAGRVHWRPVRPADVPTHVTT